MKIKEYLEQEKIEDLTTSDIGDLIQNALTEEQYEIYDKMHNTFCDDNNQPNIIEFYELVAEFELMNIMQSSLYNRTETISSLINEHIKDSKKVLDIGSGNGLKSVFYALNHPETQFTCLDLSEAMLKLVQKRAKKNKCKNIETQVADMTNMNLEQKYDCVIAEHSLHETAEYVMNPSTYGFESNPLFWVKFDQIYNVMDKGKIIITLTPNHPEFLRDEIKFEMENAGFIHKETQTLYHHNNGQEILDLLFVGEK